MEYKIDFVMIWVDGGDPAWRQEKDKYFYKETGMVDGREARYRDWDNIKYWFRAVEQFAPWVNKVFFVTCGHIPQWLNLGCPKLVHVRHSDYMPGEYLPTFNANPIELNIHRIDGISEHIVYFNDDMFITRPIKPDIFFRNGLPVHQARLHGILPLKDGGVMTHIYANDVTCINRNFAMKEALRDNWKKWYLPWRVGVRNVIGNIYNYMYAEFPGFGNEHLPVPFLKSVINEVWEKEYALLHQTSLNKFRNMQDVNQYLFRYWQLCSGRFVPEKARKLGQRITVASDVADVCHAISHQKYHLFCLNDMGGLEQPGEFERVKQEIQMAFEKILPDKSSFEQ